MNRYYVVFKVIDFDYRLDKPSEITLCDIVESEKLNEDLFNKIYSMYHSKQVLILNVIKLED